MTGEFSFGKHPSTEGVVNASFSRSADGEAMSVFFSNLTIDTMQQRGELSVKTYSCLLPVESEIDLTVTLNVLGMIALDPSYRAALVVRHAGETVAIDFGSQRPERGGKPIEHSLTARIAAGRAYRVMLILIVERLAVVEEESGLIQIDALDIELNRLESEG